MYACCPSNNKHRHELLIYSLFVDCHPLDDVKKVSCIHLSVKVQVVAKAFFIIRYTFLTIFNGQANEVMNVIINTRSPLHMGGNVANAYEYDQVSINRLHQPCN